MPVAVDLHRLVLSSSFADSMLAKRLSSCRRRRLIKRPAINNHPSIFITCLITGGPNYGIIQIKYRLILKDSKFNDNFPPANC